MKSLPRGCARARAASLPVRGAWVEILADVARILQVCRRSPCGERGLKFLLDCTGNHQRRSLPVRGAWVEICKSGAAGVIPAGRSPCGERGLKFSSKSSTE